MKLTTLALIGGGIWLGWQWLKPKPPVTDMYGVREMVDRAMITGERSLLNMGVIGPHNG